MITLRRVGVKGSKLSRSAEFTSTSAASELSVPASSSQPCGPDLIHLVAGHKYTFGRKHCDFSFDDDSSVSRKHAEVEVNYASANLSDPDLKPNLLVTDVGSKFGTYTNEGITTKTKLQKMDVSSIDVDGKVRFGLQWNEYVVEYTPLIVTTSTLRQSGPLKVDLWKLSGTLVSEWTPECDYLVMENITLTIKVVAALLAAKPIVTPQYFTDLVDYYSLPTGSNKAKPEPESYLPPVTERGLTGEEPKFQVQEDRKILFAGKLFLFESPSKLAKFKAAIESGGGRVDLVTNTKIKSKEIQDDNTLIVGNLKQLKSAGGQIKKVLDIYLSTSKVRTIPECNIGLSVVHMDIDKYCNPCINNPAIVTQQMVIVSQTQSDSPLSSVDDDSQSSLRRRVQQSRPNPHEIYTQSQTRRSVIDETIETSAPASDNPLPNKPEPEADKPRTSVRSKRRIQQVEAEDDDDVQTLQTQKINLPKRPCTQSKINSTKRLAAVFGMSSSDEDDEVESSRSRFVIPATLPEDRIDRSENSETVSVIPPTPEDESQLHGNQLQSQLLLEGYESADSSSGISVTTSIVPDSEVHDVQDEFVFQRPGSQRIPTSSSKRGRNELGSSISEQSDDSSSSSGIPGIQKKRKVGSQLNAPPNSVSGFQTTREEDQNILPTPMENRDPETVKLNCSFQSLLISKKPQCTPLHSSNSNVRNFKPFRKVHPKIENKGDQSNNTASSGRSGNISQVIFSFSTVYYHPLEGRIVVVKNDGRTEELLATTKPGEWAAEVVPEVEAQPNESPPEDDGFQFQQTNKSKPTTTSSRLNTIRKELEQRHQVESETMSQESDEFAF